MKTSFFKGVMESAYGKNLEKPIRFEGSFEELQNVKEIPAKEYPTDEDILSFVNNKRKAAERQKVMNAALFGAGVEKPKLEEDKQAQLRMIFKALVAAGRSENEARQVASATLGIKWED
jgi:hypothetical protein